MEAADFAWLVTVVLTGTAAGAMAGHTILLGRFLNWMFESGKTEVFRDTYPVFIRQKSPQTLFDGLFTLTLLVTTAFDAYLYYAGRLTLLPVIAVVLQ